MCRHQRQSNCHQTDTLTRWRNWRCNCCTCHHSSTRSVGMLRQARIPIFLRTKTVSNPHYSCPFMVCETAYRRKHQHQRRLHKYSPIDETVYRSTREMQMLIKVWDIQEMWDVTRWRKSLTNYKIVFRMHLITTNDNVFASGLNNCFCLSFYVMIQSWESDDCTFWAIRDYDVCVSCTLF